MNKHIRLLVCGFLFCCMAIGLTGSVMAAPSLQWQSERVYYDSTGSIVIEGYFYNNGSRTVTWVNWFEVNVYFRQNNTNWWRQASATFGGQDLRLDPGESRRWTFRITNVDRAYFDYWDVKWNVNYQYE
ncbi:MAG: hypothetical protein P4N59_02395 [Negativicutes bacterium]|nr:hypothetical protein [Negativicutes bacterium]